MVYSIEYAKVQGYDIHVQIRKGIRFAYLEALDKIKGEIIISFSPNGNSPPEAILKLKEK